MFLNSTLTSRGMCVLHTLDTLSRRLPCPSGGVGVRTALRSKDGDCDCSWDMVRSRSTGGGRWPEASGRRSSSGRVRAMDSAIDCAAGTNRPRSSYDRCADLWRPRRLDVLLS